MRSVALHSLMDTVFVRHRTASGCLDSCWEYDSARRVIEVVFRLGEGSPIALTLPVCAIDKPRFHAFALARFDDSSWRLLPVRYVLAHPSRDDERLVHDERALHPSLDRGTQIILTNAPADVAADIEELSL